MLRANGLSPATQNPVSRSPQECKRAPSLKHNKNANHGRHQPPVTAAPRPGGRWSAPRAPAGTRATSRISVASGRGAPGHAWGSPVRAACTLQMADDNRCQAPLGTWGEGGVLLYSDGVGQLGADRVARTRRSRAARNTSPS